MSGRKISLTNGCRPLSRAAIMIRECPGAHAPGFTPTPASQAKTSLQFNANFTLRRFRLFEARPLILITFHFFTNVPHFPHFPRFPLFSSLPLLCHFLVRITFSGLISPHVRSVPVSNSAFNSAAVCNWRFSSSTVSGPGESRMARLTASRPCLNKF